MKFFFNNTKQLVYKVAFFVDVFVFLNVTIFENFIIKNNRFYKIERENVKLSLILYFIGF